MPYDDLIEKHFRRVGLDPALGRRIMKIESGGDPKNTTGSYRGLFQLDSSEFKKHGGTGNIYDPEQNIMAAANKLSKESLAFEQKHGRKPKERDIYGMHQQGEAGYAAHLKNPEGIAWQNVRPYYTDAAAKKKGFASGDAYAKAAIWGNVPDEVKAKYGSVDKMTSKDFTELWASKVEGREVAGGAKSGGTGPDGEAKSAFLEATDKPKKLPTLLGQEDFPMINPQYGNLVPRFSVG